ncbi:MAG: PD-(D/E)XK nuclease family protein, partial [bacterium]|nr:PD-(D/E)XK nuclease family protein [bacterium]
QIIEQELALWEKENLPQGSSLWNPQKERILRALKAVLEQEIVRFQQSPQKLTPTAFEKRLNPPLTLRCGSETIQMGGVIDRIDVDPEEKKFLVIDYKTGSRVTSLHSFESGEALQLPLYVEAVRSQIFPDFKPIGAIFYRLHDLTRKEGFVKISDSEKYLCLDSRTQAALPDEEWEEVLRKTKKTVEKIIGQMKRGNFSQQETKCDAYCEFKDICRCGI